MKNNKFQDAVREYVKKLSDDDIRFLNVRLNQRMGGDLGEAVECIQDSSDMDYWLSMADNATEFFDMVDLINQVINNELKKRFLTTERKS